ncbi:hypothetical protein ACFX15_004106 [Malus domestica]
MVQQLLNQLRVVVDERKKTFQLTLYVLLYRHVNEKGNSYWEKNCHQILIEMGLRKLFVPSMREDWGLRRMQNNQLLNLHI